MKRSDIVFRLLLLATWFDIQDEKKGITGENEVQGFLRYLADKISVIKDWEETK